MCLEYACKKALSSGCKIYIYIQAFSGWVRRTGRQECGQWVAAAYDLCCLEGPSSPKTLQAANDLTISRTLGKDIHVNHTELDIM